MMQRHHRTAWILAFWVLGWSTVLALILVLLAPNASAQADKVELCHAAPPDAENKYVMIPPSAAGAYHGHYLQHTDDIIPPFEFGGVTYSLNWTAEGRAIFENGCVVPDEPEPAPSPTRTVAPPRDRGLAFTGFGELALAGLAALLFGAGLRFYTAGRRRGRAET